jgi:hypothetical protein
MRIISVILGWALLVGSVAHAQTSLPSSQPQSLPASAPASLSAEPISQPTDPKPTKEKSPKAFKLKPPKLTGYFQVFYRYALPTGEDPVVDNSNFRVQRLRIGVEGKLFPWLSYDVEIDPRAPEVTGFLRDAFFSIALPKHQELRIGQQKTQFGYENRASSTNLFAVNRAEFSDAIARGANLRDVGLGLIGHLPLGNGWRLEDALSIVNGNGLNTQDDNTAAKNVWGRVGLRYQDKKKDLQVWFGLSGAIGDKFEPEDPLIPDDNDALIIFKRVGADMKIDHPRFQINGEVGLSQESLTLQIANPPPPEEELFTGYYVSLIGKTKREVGPVLRLDTFSDGFIRWTLGAYYGLPGQRFRLLVNYELRQLKDDVRGDDKFYIWSQVKF